MAKKLWHTLKAHQTGATASRTFGALDPVTMMAKLCHDRKQREARMSLPRAERARAPYVDFLKPASSRRDPAMGCATSTEARRDMVWVGANAHARQSFSLPSVDRQRLRLRAMSMLGTLSLAGSARHSNTCRHAMLSVEEMMKGDNDHAPEAAHADADVTQRARGDQRVGAHGGARGRRANAALHVQESATR